MGLKPCTRYNASFISREFKFSRQLTQSASWIAYLPLAISPQRVHHVAQATTRRASPSSALPFARNSLIILSTSRKLFVKQNFGIVPKSTFSVFGGQCPDAGLKSPLPKDIGVDAYRASLMLWSFHLKSGRCLSIEVSVLGLVQAPPPPRP